MYGQSRVRSFWPYSCRCWRRWQWSVATSSSIPYRTRVSNCMALSPRICIYSLQVVCICQKFHQICRHSHWLHRRRRNARHKCWSSDTSTDWQGSCLQWLRGGNSCGRLCCRWPPSMRCPCLRPLCPPKRNYPAKERLVCIWWPGNDQWEGTSIETSVFENNFTPFPPWLELGSRDGWYQAIPGNRAFLAMGIYPNTLYPP